MTPLRVLETVCSLSLQVTLLVAAAALLARYACRSDRARDQLWTATFVALLLLCCGDLALPHLRLLPVPASIVDPALGTLVAERAWPLAWVAVVWGAGAALLLGRLALGTLRAGLLFRRAVAIPPLRLAATVGAAFVSSASDERPARGTGIRFLTTSEILTPFCWQWHRPTIVLPEFLLTFSAEEMAVVIRHELRTCPTRIPCRCSSSAWPKRCSGFILPCGGRRGGPAPSENLLATHEPPDPPSRPRLWCAPCSGWPSLIVAGFVRIWSAPHWASRRVSSPPAHESCPASNRRLRPEVGRKCDWRSP